MSLLKRVLENRMVGVIHVPFYGSSPLFDHESFCSFPGHFFTDACGDVLMPPPIRPAPDSGSLELAFLLKNKQKKNTNQRKEPTGEDLSLLQKQKFPAARFCFVVHHHHPALKAARRARASFRERWTHVKKMCGKKNRKPGLSAESRCFSTPRWCFTQLKSLGIKSWQSLATALFFHSLKMDVLPK